MPFDLADVWAAVPPKWTVERALNHGGQGTVFLATESGRHVVLKIFEPDDPRRVEREVDFLRNHDCPNLVKAFDRFDIHVGGVNLPVVVYEFHPRGDLNVHLQAHSPPLSEGTLIEIAVSVARAIEALWGARIVHRDIKPGNIVIAGDGRYVLADLGFALHLDRSSITAANLAVGTLPYMSPEQLRGSKDLTCRSDVFSLGVTLYQLAAKRVPFLSPAETRSLNSAPPLMSRRPDLSFAFTSLIGRMLEKRFLGRPCRILEACEATRRS